MVPYTFKLKLEESRTDDGGMEEPQFEDGDLGDFQSAEGGELESLEGLEGGLAGFRFDEGAMGELLFEESEAE